MGWSRPLPFLVQNGIHGGILPDRLTVFVGAEVKIFDKLSLFPHPESLHQTLGRFVFGIAHGDDAMGKTCAERCLDDSGGSLGRVAFFPVRTIEYPADFPGGKRTGREKDVSDLFAPWMIVIGRQTNGDEIGIGNAFVQLLVGFFPCERRIRFITKNLAVRHIFTKRIRVFLKIRSEQKPLCAYGQDNPSCFLFHGSYSTGTIQCSSSARQRRTVVQHPRSL